MKFLFAVTIFLKIVWAEDFISEFEYGQMLYKDPRGVSCASCHGKVGDGSYIASYVDKDGKKHDFYAPDIRKLSLAEFKQAVSAGGKLMPKYYLTNKESEAIYKYIQVVNNYQKESTEREEESVESNSTLDDNLSLEDNDTEDNKTENSIISKIFKVDQEIE